MNQIFLYMGASVSVALPLYQLTRIIRMYLNKFKIVPTHMVRTTFSEPTKGEMYYKKNLDGLKLGLKIRRRNFKHVMNDGIDVIDIIGSEKDMKAYIASRDTPKNQELEKKLNLEDRTGSIKTEELIKIETE